MGGDAGLPGARHALFALLTGSESLSKDLAAADNYSETNAGRRARRSTAESSRAPVSRVQPPALVKLETIYAESARFVWLTLQRAGVRRADLDDVCHDVFVIVQRKLPEFEPGAELRPWLLGICVRTAANYRRRARIRLEQSNVGTNGEEAVVAIASETNRPDSQLSRRQALERADAILAHMSPVKRAVFIMFEIEGMNCQEIAAELGLPVGTVYSRLHSARKLFLERATIKSVARSRHG